MCFIDFIRIRNGISPGILILSCKIQTDHLFSSIPSYHVKRMCKCKWPVDQIMIIWEVYLKVRVMLFTDLYFLLTTRGLMCIHRMKIVHRDLKSANCLVNKHSTVKICDFGLSRIMTETPMRDSSSAGTPEWMAPELIRNEPFTEKCDIFSLGVIMWELCTLNRPWEGVPPERVHMIFSIL